MPKDLTPQKIIDMLLRHVKLIVLIAALVTLIAYGYSSFFITPIYTSSSLILIQNYDQNSDMATQATSYYNSSDNRVPISDIQQSATLAGHCVIVFNNVPEMTALMTDTGVRVEQVEESSFVRFTVSSSNAQKAANVANQLAEQSAETFAKLFKNKGRIDTIRSAEPAGAPSSPDIKRNTLYGLVIGLIIGVLLAFFLEIVDTTLKPGDDLAKLYGLPVFADIIDFEKEG